MLVELSQFLLALAFAAALAQTALGARGAVAGDAQAEAAARAAALVQAVAAGLSFAGLVHAFAVSDFSVLSVANNSHTDKPLLYKISAAWGHHEGSMLLWCLVMAALGAVVARAPAGTGGPGHTARVLAVHGTSSALFLAFLIFTSNPFGRVLPTPDQGSGLNPLLQDPALAAHPPMLYAGYIGFSVVFAHAVAALWEGRVDRDWARLVRPWALGSWIALTCGIALGSFWAYYELGWGGWWAWDPVENASLAPWLVGAALIHTILVTARTGAMAGWTVLLSILAFALSVLGTFLVRSGVLTSVHAFANDPERGVFLLGILAVLAGGALALFAVRAPRIAAGGAYETVSREGALVLNNFAMALATLAVLLGTLYPLFVSGISVGPPFYNLVVGLVTLPVLLLAPAGPLLAWKRGDGRAAARALAPAMLAALGAGALALFLVSPGAAVAALAFALGVFLVFGAASDPVRRAAFGRKDAGTALRRLGGLPLSAWASTAAHAGLGVFLMGAVASGAWMSRTEEVVRPGEQVVVAGRALSLETLRQTRGPNYVADVARFTDDRGRAYEAERRFYPAGRTPTTEVALERDGIGQTYIALGDPRGGGVLVAAAYFPLIDWVYGGALLMAFGGGLGWFAARRERAA